jgi:hypothetical protein
MSLASLRVRGWVPGARKIWFIHILRTYTNLGLREAKEFMDRFDADGQVHLPLLDADKSRTMGEDLLEKKLVQHAELIFSDDAPVNIDGPPPRPPVVVTVLPRPPKVIHHCPSCNQQLKNELECGNCGWVRFSGDKSRWKLSGGCPKCGFTYRWDGSICSHCGYPSQSKAIKDAKLDGLG